MIGDNGYDWIVRRLEFHEGLRLMAYKCSAGKLTIGIGRNLEDNPLTAEEKKAVGDWKHGISRNAAYMLLRNDIKRCITELKETFDFYATLDIERQYALLDMDFQLGLAGLKKFQNMLRWFRMKDYKKAAEECLHSTYAKQTPARAKRIARTIREGLWLRD